MAPQEIRVPFPLDMMGDLDTTLRYVEDRHLSDPNAAAAGFHPLAAAVRAIKSAIQAYREKAAAEAVAMDSIQLERSHLSTLMDYAPDGIETGGDAHRAAFGNVSEWLDRDI